MIGKKYDLYLDVLSIHEIERFREHRNKISKYGIYRTPFLLTEDMQKDFFENIVNNRKSNNRYFAVKINECKEESLPNDDKCEVKQHIYNKFIGIVGLTNIQWENGISEIALTIFQEWKIDYLVLRTVELILIEAFYNLRLNNVFGECYECNPDLDFWKEMKSIYGNYSTMLPSRKYYDGVFYDSYYFNINNYFFYQKLKELKEKGDKK